MSSQLDALCFMLDKWQDSLETGIDAEEDAANLLNIVAYAVRQGHAPALIEQIKPLTDKWLGSRLRAGADSAQPRGSETRAGDGAL